MITDCINIPKILLRFIGLSLITISLNSCATMFGGSQYTALVYIRNHPNAEIVYKGVPRGIGMKKISVPRKDANKFSFKIKEEGCEEQSYYYDTRVFRGWAFTGSLIFWTGVTPSGIPLPYGIVVDGVAGSWFKPDVKHPDISKSDINNYTYSVDYSGCNNTAPVQEEIDESTEDMSKYVKLRELSNLYKDGVLSEEEFKKEKQKILDEK